MDSARKGKEADYPKQDAEPLNASAPILTQPTAQTPNRPEPVPRHVIWIHRISMVVFVVFCIELGLFIAVLPWMSIWNSNSFVLTHPGLHEFIRNNFVRGAISGVGIIDLWIGIWEAVHYRDPVAIEETSSGR
jgi:hypothetical protein